MKARYEGLVVSKTINPNVSRAVATAKKNDVTYLYRGVKLRYINHGRNITTYMYASERMDVLSNVLGMNLRLSKYQSD